MGPDNYQQAWKVHASRTRITIDVDLLLKEVQRNERKFRATIFWRDYRDFGITLLLLPVWIYMGVTLAFPWTWYLTVPVLVWVAGFTLMYRIRHKQKLNSPDEPLFQCVERSLTEVEDQIWLVRNAFRLYLLPLGISALALIAHSVWLGCEGWLEAVGLAVTLVVFSCAAYYSIGCVTRYVVRSQLEPRRQELLMLLTSLGNETNNEG